ncbi:MAG: Polysaccharide biosynthesis protein [Parcubacteria group bacterium GW2011_GWA1_36_12]|nr:MAG: Polysaccharide biosynthesis protein [Parcubacteria group bacterium GW2011_GWA1_36_12]
MNNKKISSNSEIGSLSEKIASGILLLSFKRISLQFVITLTNITLARLLFPADFGMFAIVTFVIAIFTVFSDLGLGPSLVQQKDDISEKDLQTTFTVQLLLSVVIILVIFGISPMIANFYNIGEKGVVLFRIYSLYLLFMPFKTTSGAILERHLQYKKLIIIEITELAVVSSLTILLAFRGFGVFSFAYSAVLGHFIGGVFYYFFVRWPIRFIILRDNLTKLARFGLSYQSNVVFGLFYGPLILLYLGKVVGPDNLGYYQWAAGFAVFPAVASEIINRVLFPLGARSQHDKQFFRKIIETSLMIVSFTSLPLAFIFMAAVPGIIHLVYTDKWLPAVPAVYLGLVQMVIIAHTGIFSQLLLARGRADVMRNMSFVWVILTWVLSPPLIHLFNFVGMSLASLLISATGIYLFFRLRQEVNFSFGKNFTLYLVSSLLCGILVFLAIHALGVTLPVLIVVMSSGLIFYVSVIWLFRGKEVFTNIRYLILSLKRTSG